jgi:hypothetical protein
MTNVRWADARRVFLDCFSLPFHRLSRSMTQGDKLAVGAADQRGAAGRPEVPEAAVGGVRRALMHAADGRSLQIREQLL